MKEAFLFFSTIAPRRRTVRQKQRFLRYFCRQLESFGLKVCLDGEIPSSSAAGTLLAGDFTKARTILAAGYDTPSRAQYPGYRYYPLDAGRNRQMEKRNILCSYAIMLAAVLLCGLLMWNTRHLPWPVRLIPYAVTAMILFLAGQNLRGWSNGFNANRNNAGMALLYKTAETRGTFDGAVAYAFCDMTAEGYLGHNRLSALLKHANPHATVLLLDCLASGESVYLTAAKRADKEQKKLLARKEVPIEPIHVEGLPLSLYPKGLLLVSGSQVYGRVVAPAARSPKDRECDVHRLKDIYRAICGYLDGSAGGKRKL